MAPEFNGGRESEKDFAKRPNTRLAKKILLSQPLYLASGQYSRVYPTTYPTMAPTKQITIRIPLPIMEAIARRCSQTGQDRTAIIVEALAAGLGVDPSRDRIDALEERVTALESKLAVSQNGSRKVTRKLSHDGSQGEPRESRDGSQTAPQDSHTESHDEPQDSHHVSLPESRDELPERISDTTMGRNSKAAGMTRNEYAAAHGYQRQGKGNKAKWIKINP